MTLIILPFGFQTMNNAREVNDIKYYTFGEPRIGMETGPNISFIG